MFSQVSATLKGLYTLRSLNMETQLLERFHQTQDGHTSAAFLFLAAGRWLGLRVDLSVAAFYTVVLVITMLVPSDGKPSFNHYDWQYMQNCTNFATFIPRNT